jgi:hypothetical protein
MSNTSFSKKGRAIFAFFLLTRKFCLLYSILIFGGFFSEIGLFGPVHISKKVPNLSKNLHSSKN